MVWLHRKSTATQRHDVSCRGLVHRAPHSTSILVKTLRHLILKVTSRVHHISWRLPPFAQAPRGATFVVNVLELHAERGTDAGEAVDNQADAIAQANRGSRINTIQKGAGFGRFQYRDLALAHDVFRATHRRSRIHRYDLADHQPVKEMADSGEALLDGGAAADWPGPRSKQRREMMPPLQVNVLHELCTSAEIH
jgi:hypothetical protein